MSVVTLPSNPDTVANSQKRAIEIHGAADVSFVEKDGETGLGRLYYRDPLKVLFPRGDVPTAALVTTGGGLFGGDIYDIDIHLEQNAKAMVTAQAAEKVYRSSGPDCEIHVNLKVDEGAALEWLPQETILFDQARFRRKTTLEMSSTAKALAGEIIVFGRLASGEEIDQGLLREAWDIKIDGKLVWADALHMEGQFQRQLNHVSGFGGARAIATCVFAGPDAVNQLEAARGFLKEFDGVRFGATAVNGILICRWLAADPYQLRKSFGLFWADFRYYILGRENILPRLWQC
ncbi:MAG: urease accessory protein UreD [Methylocystaceae bacterium]|nr:urease accessory protein UreD [Methylocystaceae bacterium]